MRIFHASFAQPVSDWLDFLAKRSHGAEPSGFEQRKSFIAARLVVSLSALALSPLWLFFHGVPTAREAALFTLMLTPLVAVAALKRTGDLRLAQRISICGWAAMAIGVAAMAQGYEALSVALLGVGLIEAMLTLEISTLGAVAAGALFLIALDVFLGSSPPQAAPTRFELAMRLAPLLLYAAALAAGPIFAERARARKEERAARDLRLLTEALGDILAHFDRTGAVTQIVGDTQRNYGLNDGDLRGRGFFRRVHVGDRPAFLKLVSDAAANIAPEHALLRINVAAIEPGGAGCAAPVYHYFEARSRPVEAISSGGTDEPQVICILRDVTAARKAEEAIAEAQRQSQLAIVAKTKFLATVSHELRTPLNAIIGFSEMLANEELEPEDAKRRREYSRIIAESGRHLHDVVNSILDMSKIESGAMQLFPEPFCYAKLVAQCCEMMQLKADQAQVALLCDFPHELDEIVADRRACKQIALNLLSNAIKFTPPCGKIVLKLFVDGNSFVLSVSDTGVGIAPSDLARLGDPFFQASASLDRNYEGAGLGLSVVRGLVGLHGGAIFVESALKAGTTVTVRLPRDGRLQRERASCATKIETIARHGVFSPRADLIHEKEAVKKIA